MQYTYICDPECFAELADKTHAVRINVGSTVPEDITLAVLRTRDRPPLVFRASNPHDTAFDAEPVVFTRLWLSRRAAGCPC